MKKLIILSTILFTLNGLFAQSVGINEDNSQPDASAILDVKSTSKGMLIPRVALPGINDITTVPNAANGLFVFSENGNVPDGLYYWNATDKKWIYVITANNITNFGSGKVITDDERTLVNTALQTEVDPVFTAHPANSIANAGSGQVITSVERTKLAGIQNNPTGTILVYAGDVLPDGYLWCDGKSYLVTNQPILYNAIGTAWGGTVDVSFNVPDLRGKFIRGVDGGAGYDPDRTSRTAINSGGNTGNSIGSYQGDAFQGHFHYNRYNNGTTAAGGDPSRVIVSTTNGTTGNSGTVVSGARSDGTNGTPRIKSETRPKNVYVNYIIKN
jgi:microcystin-dependent protein